MDFKKTNIHLAYLLTYYIIVNMSQEKLVLFTSKFTLLRN